MPSPLSCPSGFTFHASRIPQLAYLAQLTLLCSCLAQSNQPFCGGPWHISTGNLSVSFIQASPVGAFPRPDILEPPSGIDSQVRLRNLGLVAHEDYIAWGAIERER